jgi:hypothetical protein
MDTVDAEHEDGMDDGDDPRASLQELWTAWKALPGDKITPGGCVQIVPEGSIGDVLVEASQSNFAYGVARSFKHKVSLN